MAKILVISANLREWKKDSGGKERTATLAEALEDHEVTFLSFAWNADSYDKEVHKNIRYIKPPINARTIKKYKTLIRGVAKKNYDACFEILKAEIPEFTNKARLLAEQSDLVIIDHMSVYPLLSLPNDVPVVYNSHNSELTMAQHLYPQDTRIVNIVEKVEKGIIKRSSAITYCSKKDFAEMEDQYGKIARSAYVPNGCEMQKYPKVETRAASKNIIFVGSGHPPNVAAAKKLLPLAKELPEYNFIIIGSAGNGIASSIIPSNVSVVGHISDEKLSEYFETSFAFINPMDSGSGTHLKMMKALSYGIPIITSQLGARGFSKQEISEAMLIAESQEEMIQAIKRLENKKTYITISKMGYTHSKTYDWAIIKKNYKAFIEKIIAEREEFIEQHRQEKVLIYSIIRNRGEHMQKYHQQLKRIVADNPEYEFYLSIYENDSTDTTKKELFSKDWSFFKGVSIVSENINTRYFNSVKDGERVQNLAHARNKAIEAGGFLPIVDYVLMIEGDVVYSPDDVSKLLNFKTKEPDFDIVSSISLRKNGTHYDWWATRTTPIYNPSRSEIEDNYNKKEYGKYYSTSNGICLYRAKPFQEGIRHGWINDATKEFDCEMVVLCQNFHKKGYNKVFILYTAKAHHV